MFNFFKNKNFKLRERAEAAGRVDDTRTERRLLRANKTYLFDEWANAKNAEGFSNIDKLPNPDKILRKTGKNISVYRDLINHYQVGACIEQRIAGTKGSEWHLLPKTLIFMMKYLKITIFYL